MPVATLVSCTADEWQLVMSNTMTGTIELVTKNRFLCTYRDTGDDAPEDDTDACSIPAHQLHVKNSYPIDVYLKSVGTTGIARTSL